MNGWVGSWTDVGPMLLGSNGPSRVTLSHCKTFNVCSRPSLLRNGTGVSSTQSSSMASCSLQVSYQKFSVLSVVLVWIWTIKVSSGGRAL